MELKRKLKKIVNFISIFLIVGCSYYSMAGSIPANINNDPSSDGIDNDNDGILDENDDDEFGDSRELAINIAINKIASDVVNSILSTW